jgi:hypothetical protein
MPSLYIWQYYLVVPIAALAAADAVAPVLNNPDGIEATFQRYPRPNDEGEYLEQATHWAASFLATNPSRQALEGYLGRNPVLESLLWVRCKNPHYTETPENERGVVVASNWAAIPVGALVDWNVVYEALS